MQPLVFRLEVVDVRAVPVDRGADRMTRAVQEVVAVARVLHDLAAGVVHFVAVDRPAFVEAARDERDGCVPGLPRDAEDLDVLRAEGSSPRSAHQVMS